MTDLATIDAGRHGAPSWVDLSTPDIEAATSFYGRLLDWGISTSTTPMGSYHIASAGSREVCGMMAHGPELVGAPAMWTVFFTVDDLATALTTVTAEGGTVLQPPIDIPGGARVAVVADPAGAVFALITGGPRPGGPYLLPDQGGVGWVEVMTRDPLAIVPFYEALFEWSTITDESSGYTMFTLDGTPVCGMLPMPAEVPAEAPSYWATYFSVSSCADVERRCVELGGEVHRSTVEVAGLRFAVLSDPQGAMFDIIEYEAHPAP